MIEFHQPIIPWRLLRHGLERHADPRDVDKNIHLSMENFVNPLTSPLSNFAPD
jgi:hypothetical protein